MGQFRVTRILLCCFFSLIVGSRSSVFAQQPPQANEKERGIELYRKGKFNEAAKALKEAVKKQGRDSDAWYYLGLSLHRAGKINDASKALEKSLSLKPDFAPAYTAMAYMRLLGNDNRRAVENADKALALDPKNFEAYYIAGMARLREGAATEALARAEEALNVKADHPQALILKTQALISLFAEEQAKLAERRGQREEVKSSGDAAVGAKRRPDYSLLKSASKSLEAYLKLSPEQSEKAFWSEQLEALRFYAQRSDTPASDKSLTGISPAQKPTVLYREKAVYTNVARDAGVQGTVILMVVFADEGVLKHILVLQGLSHGLTEQAIAAARKIRFAPAMRDGKPTTVIGSLEFTFNLY